MRKIRLSFNSPKLMLVSWVWCKQMRYMNNFVLLMFYYLKHYFLICFNVVNTWKQNIFHVQHPVSDANFNDVIVAISEDWRSLLVRDQLGYHAYFQKNWDSHKIFLPNILENYIHKFTNHDDNQVYKMTMIA